MPTNQEFLTALFGADSQWVHVTDFLYDPSAIPAGRELSAWKGDYNSRYQLQIDSNQYFCISTFGVDEKNIARRRKALFRSTHVIVLDDVKEKLSLEEANKLPAPSWILETSPGSEQWGYILNQPAADRHRVDNLLDGLVNSGLAPSGRDPGMKGVTRYVRLPEGINNKSSKLVNGFAFRCRMVSWSPFNRVTLEQLAAPFLVNLDAQRREQRVDGAASVDDHPLLNVPDIIHIKEERSDGRFDVTCPWVEEHTGADDSGAAIFTNKDGTMGFKCHHGACQSRTGADLLRLIEEEVTGFTRQLKTWQVERSFAEMTGGVPLTKQPPLTSQPVIIKPHVSFIITPPVSFVAPTIPQPPTPEADPLQKYMDLLRSQNPSSKESQDISTKLLELVDQETAIEKMKWHNEIRDVMGWTKQEMKTILHDLRQEWYVKKSATTLNFYNDVLFVKELNQFYDRSKRIFYTPDAYQNAHADLDAEVRKNALQGGMVTKTDRIDYAPLKPAVFQQGNITYANSWSDISEVKGVEGDISRYLDHFDTLGWAPHREHLLKWMAYTIRHPDKKINHMVLLGGAEGIGKDWLLQPLVVALGENHTTIEGDELIGDYQDYLLSSKHVHINEAELGDRKEAEAVSTKIKRLASAPPATLRVNQKHVKQMDIRNIVSISMSTNSMLPFKLKGASRRIFALWSDLMIRDTKDNLIDGWEEYWVDRWDWMNSGGAEAVIHYLRNEVDLSNFNPGKAPAITDFLRSIREASKSPMQQTIEAFIERRAGAFASDLVTAGDMAATLKVGELLEEDIMYVDRKVFTPTKIGCVLRDIPSCVRLRARKKYDDLNIWVVRNIQAYRHMTPAELMDEYERQLKATRVAKPARLVAT